MLPKIVFISITLISLNFKCNSQSKMDLKDITGTWMSEEYYTGLIRSSIPDVTPRIIYIQPDGRLSVENRFEYMYSLALKSLQRSNNKKQLLNYGSTQIRTINDTLLVLDFQKANRKIKFKKISKNFSCTACGIQLFFMDYFFKNNFNWKLISNSDSSDPKDIYLQYGAIVEKGTKDTITMFEFADVSQTMDGDEKYYNIMFFKTNGNFVSENEQFAVKKEGDNIILLKNHSEKYRLIPAEKKK